MTDDLLLIRLNTNEDGVTATGLGWFLDAVGTLASKELGLTPEQELRIHEIRKGSIMIWLKSPQLQGAAAVVTVFSAFLPILRDNILGDQGITTCSVAAERLLHHEGVSDIEMRCGDTSISVRRSDVRKSADLVDQVGNEALLELSPTQRSWINQISIATIVDAIQTAADLDPPDGLSFGSITSPLPDELRDAETGAPKLTAIGRNGAELPSGPFLLPHEDSLGRTTLRGRFSESPVGVVFGAREGGYVTVLPLDDEKRRVFRNEIFEIAGILYEPNQSGLKRLFANDIKKIG
ncbi:hypothetical protein [Novosphingobium sp.]|uniref:hypothetical protein n=1 Tax=Novosphingobium sp. TaxID=1874826 RepID=UPI00260F7434|nr:hypothetical protein [Novosphingobium sp.]